MAYTKIVVGTDGSETSFQAVEYAARLAAMEGAELIAVYASSSPGESVLASAEAISAPYNVSPRGVIEKGDPAEVLITVAENEQADLLVLGNKGMTGTGRFLLGSVPNRVSHTSPCDLLIVKTT